MNKIFLVNEHDHWAWTNFRKSLEKSLLDKGYSILIISYKDSRTTKNDHLTTRVRRKVISKRRLFPVYLVKEAFYRKKFASKASSELCIGSRTFFFRSLFQFKKQTNMIVFFPGLGRSKRYGKNFWSYMTWKLLKLGCHIIVLNDDDKRILKLEGHHRLHSIASEGLTLIDGVYPQHIERSDSLLYLGRINRSKGIFKLIDLIKNDLDLQLDIYGFGD